jgi:hypothetical protein
MRWKGWLAVIVAGWLAMTPAVAQALCADRDAVADCLEALLAKQETTSLFQASRDPALHARALAQLTALSDDIRALATDLSGEDVAAADHAQVRISSMRQRALTAYQVSWQQRSLFEGLAATPGDSPRYWLLMVRLERDQASEAVTSLRQRWKARLDAESEGLSRYRDLIGAFVVLILAMVVFVFLHRLARRSIGALLQVHNLIIEHAGKRRWPNAIARLFSGIAPLAPWVLLWLVLNGFDALLSGTNAPLLQWWVPLAQLYIIYGFLCLVAEWILLRITAGAGVFLNNDQNRQLTQHAHIRVRWIIWPWVLLYVIDHWIGPSLLYRLFELGAWVMAWFAVGSLLKARRADYLTNLQRLLPERLDPLAERLLSEKAFLWNAALWLPLQLLLFVRQYLDQLLADFDWYRSLSARWFRMRTQSQIVHDESEMSTEEVCEQYERWFSAAGPDNTKLPTIDTGLLPAMTKTLNAWHAERTDENTLLITGEKGIGKSAALQTLAQHIGKEMDDVVVHRIAVPAKTISREAVFTLIGDLLELDMGDGPKALALADESREPTVIMLDEAQNLFLAEVGYLNGWRALLELTNTKVENIFWVIAINNQSWAYLCNVFGREYQMRQVIRVKRWSQHEIRSLILSRNHLSGYKLRYDDILLATRGPDAGNLRNAEQRYFSLLWDSCRGVPLTALELWLTSIRTDRRTVTVGLPQVPGISMLERLGPKLLFVYAAIATHENLTTEEIGMVTNQPENVVRYALKTGLDGEFIARGNDGRYRITPLWYHTVISYLTRKNMLHE